MRDDGELAWLVDAYDSADRVSVVIEQQGSIHSPITQLCHCLHGFFLGIQSTRPNDRGVVYVRS